MKWAVLTLGLASLCVVGGSRLAKGPLPGALQGERGHDAARAALPPLIIANAGQWPAEVAFVARVGGCTTAFQADRIRLGPHDGAGLSLVFEGALASTHVEGEGLQPGRVHFLHGRDPGAWVRDVPTWAGLRYAGLLPGIDLSVHVRDDRLEYDVLLAPGADLEALTIRCEGARGLALDEEGALVIETPDGSLRQRVLAAWQSADSGQCEPIACAFRLLADAGGAPGFGFDCPGRDRGRALVVDPTLEYSTLLGGMSGDQSMALAVDTDGNTYIAGYTGSTDFPTSSGAYSEVITGTNGDGFVAKLNPDGDNLIYATFIGGTAVDQLNGIALDPAGAAYVCGATFSTDFPVTPGASQTVHGGSDDGFVFKLSPAGSDLEYCTFFGGTLGDDALSIAVAPGGEACVIGTTFSADLPTTPGAFDTTYNGEYPATDAFVLRLAADGSARVWSTYLGSSFWDAGNAIAVDEAGFSYVTGYTEDDDFPTTPGVLMPHELGGINDAYVVKLDPAGQQVFGTYLGGTDGDAGWGIAVDAAHAIYVTGGTSSDDFPLTPGAFDTEYAVEYDIFVTKLLPEGRALAWSTLLNTDEGGEIGEGIVVDRAGAATVFSAINYPFYPTTPDAYQPSWSGDLFTADAVLTKLHATADTLVYSTHFEGTGGDYPAGIGLDGQGGTYLAGFTYSQDFPVTPAAFQTVRQGVTDVFVARFDLPIGPWTVLAGGSHGSVDVPNLVGFGPLTAGSDNGLALRGAPALKSGLLVAGLSAIDMPYAGGVLVPSPDILVSLGTTALGRFDLPFAWPAGVPSGVPFFVQAWVFDAAGVGGKSSSNAVQAVTP